jgi:hypothetical protein
MGEYDQYVAIAPTYLGDVLVFAAGQPVPASHPRLASFLSAGTVAPTAYATPRALTGRTYLGSRSLVSVGHTESAVAASFTVASASYTDPTSQSAMSVATPTGLQAGDLLVGIHFCDENGSLAGLTAPDASWTAQGAGGSSASGFGKVWTKLATASEPASYAFNGPAGGSNVLATDTFSTGSSWSGTWTTGASTTGASATVGSGVGNINAGTLTGFNGYRAQMVNIATRQDTEVLTSFRFNSSDALFIVGLRGPSDGFLNSTSYFVKVAKGGAIDLKKVVSGTETTIATAASGTSAGTWYQVRFRLVGTSLQVKLWTGSEPGTWTLTGTDSAITAAGYTFVGAAGGSAASGNIDVDDVTVTDPGASASPVYQQMTLLRVTGASPTSPLSVTPSWASSSSAATSHPANGITTPAQAIHVAAYHIRHTAGSNTWTAPAGYATVGPPLVQTAGLTYDFSAQDVTNWTGWGANAAVASGRLSVNGVNTYPGITTTATYSLNNRDVTVEIPQSGTPGNGSMETYLIAQVDVNNRLILMISGTNLVARELIAGTPTDATVTYNAISHRYLRIRSSGSTIFWEASPDRAVWTTIRTKTTSLALTAMSFALTHGFYGSEPSPPAALFDNFSLGAGAKPQSELVAWKGYATTATVAAQSATSSVTTTATKGELTASLAIRLAGTEPPPGTGLQTSGVCAMWWHTWSAPHLASWPADVIGSGVTAGLVNHVGLAIAQASTYGTGKLTWAMSDGTAASAAVSAIAAVRARNVNVVLVVGGSDGGVRVQTAGNVTDFLNTLDALKTQYGFNGVEIVLQPNLWTQAQMVSLASGLKTTYGSTFLVGFSGRLDDTSTTAWLALLTAAAANVDYFSLWAEWVAEARDDRLVDYTLAKLGVLNAAAWPMSKTMVLVMTTPPEKNLWYASPVAVTRKVWVAARAAYPTLLGMEHENSRTEGARSPSWPWTREVGALIRNT